MPKLLRQLFALVAVGAVAPASASHLIGAAAVHSDCPYERAELAAAGYEPIAAASEPADGSLFDPGRRSSFLAP